MALWVLRWHRAGDREQQMLEQSVAGIGWVRLPDLSSFQDREALMAAYRRAYPSARGARLASDVGQLHAFVHSARRGDLVALPLKGRTPVAIGEIIGDYAYRTDLGPEIVHARAVRWIRTAIPRSQLDQDLDSAFDSPINFSRVQRSRAEERARQIAASPALDDTSSFASDRQNSEQRARAEILDHIRRTFPGSRLARLVGAVLQARGALTVPAGLESRESEATILAAVRQRHSERLRLCVQVEPANRPLDRNELYRFKDALASLQAEQGLLVSWGGFTDDTRREVAAASLGISLWDAQDLLDAIFTGYEQLPEDVRAEIPLKRVWALDPPQAGEQDREEE